MPPKVHRIDHLVLTVADIPATVRFYTSVLGAVADEFIVADGSKRWALHIGQQKINLHQLGREFEPKAARPLPGSADLCFLTDGAPDAWVAHLNDHGVPVEGGPVPRTGATGPIRSVYFRDPDMNLIEVGSVVAEVQ